MARPTETDTATRRILKELERRELLLQAGGEFPSVANLVAGEAIRGSWWAHPKSNLIYWVCQDLEAHPRVTEARLIAGKVTQVWHTAWPDIAAIALAREPWQLAGLTKEDRELLDRVDDEDIRTDALAWHGARKLGDTCRLLERRLLVKADEVHTDSGRHAKVLGAWQRWWHANGRGELPDPLRACARLEQLVGDAARHLPWNTKSGVSKGVSKGV